MSIIEMTANITMSRSQNQIISSIELPKDNKRPNTNSCPITTKAQNNQPCRLSFL
ncbi:hypothetical protein [Moraxella lacunata]|uniref:hypothetical protein n=1 Tax=Moraxella lacunata TaxID=477 RepID=UPI003EDED57D